MPNCAVINCKNRSNVSRKCKANLSFHRFPHDPSLKEKWIKATGNKDWYPTKYSTICSIHFEEASFAEGKKHRTLTKAAYPTIDVLKTTTNELQDCNDAPPVFLKKEVAETVVVKMEPENTEDALDSDSQDSDSEDSMDTQDVMPSGSQKRGGAVFEQPQFVSCGIKANAEDAVDPTKIRTLEGQLRFCESKIREQKLKIKRLQSVNRRLRNKMSTMNEQLIRLKDKNSASKEDGSDREKNTKLGNYFQNFS